MVGIALYASFGDQEKMVCIEPVKAAGLIYHVMMDNRYQGSIHTTEGGSLIFTEQKAGVFTAQDIAYMVEVATGHYSEYLRNPDILK